MIRAFLWAALFVTAAAVSVAAGVALLVAPGRTARLLRDYFAVFPTAESRRARSLYRVFGALLAVFGAVHGIDVGRSVLRVMLGNR